MSTKVDLEELLKSFTKSGPAGCGVSVYKNGKEVTSLCEGYADLEAKRKFSSTDIIRLFSNTKVFTNVAVLTLFEKGKFLLNDPIERYLPEFSHPTVGVFTHNGTYTIRPAKSSIRIKDLMSMSSGLTYGTKIAGGENSQTNIRIQRSIDELEEKGGYTVRDFSKALAAVPLLFDPGTSWHYGYSHDILGALIEVVSDMSFGEYLQKAVLNPLGLGDTSFFISETKKHRLARQYTEPDVNGKVAISEEMDFNYNPEHKFQSGGAGLLSTLNDFSRFAAVLSMGGILDGVRILSRNTINLMRENHLGPSQLAAFMDAQENGWDFAQGYGYGLGVRTMIDKVRGGSNGSIGEFGWGGAAGTYLMADMEQNLSVAYVQQVLPNPYEAYCHHRLRAVIYSMEL
jgi:CubicO group peptidase (beta-lactamase class C family)